ncbi:MAG: hypothetical protein ACKV19_08010 [Verrucomicrobiales bacterium]
MPTSLLKSRCLRHTDRPAVARCQRCGQAYCRECVVEHDRRLVCAECLRHQVMGSTAGRERVWRQRVPWAAGVQWGVAILCLWWLFYGLGVMLRRIPATMHNGVTWLP